MRRLTNDKEKKMVQICQFYISYRRVVRTTGALLTTELLTIIRDN